MKAPAIDQAKLQEQVKRLQVYICKNLLEPEDLPKAKAPISSGNIRFSLAEPSYDNDRIRDMSRFLSEARLDTAMFDSPALKNTYRRWENSTAARRTFSSEVIRRLKDSGMRPAAFYKAAELDKRVYSSMKRDYCYTPSRTTAIKCCFGLHLSYLEAEELLKLAGYSLSPSISWDLVIRFCLENGIHEIYNVNYLLEALDETPMP